MKDNSRAVAILSGVTILCVVGLLLYSCQNSRRNYYAAQHDCVSNGGTWFPKDEFTAMCIKF